MFGKNAGVVFSPADYRNGTAEIRCHDRGAGEFAALGAEEAQAAQGIIGDAMESIRSMSDLLPLFLQSPPD